MSDEHFLLRWSRRKREAIEETAVPAPEPERGEGTTAPPPGDADKPAPPAPKQPAQSNVAAFDPASLPPIESITAETDIRAFLAPGVPAETARAALRRAWSADPAIRDFVGLAEYAWDFTKPDSMPGFGPLQMTDQLRRYAAEILGEAEQESAAPVQAPAAATRSAADETSKPSAAEPGRAVADLRETGDAADDSANVIVDDRPAAAQHDPDLPLLAKRSHGGALPE